MAELTSSLTQPAFALLGSPTAHLSGLAGMIDYMNGFEASEDSGESGPVTTEVLELFGEDEDEDEDESTPKNIEAAITLVVDAAGVLAGPGLQVRDFESLFNLLVYVSVLSVNNADHVLKLLDLLAHSCDTHAHSVAVISVLSNLFNLLPPSSPLRQRVFSTVVSVAAKTGNTALLLPQLKQLPQWVEEWELSPAEHVALLTSIAAEIETVDLRASLKYMLEAHTIAAASNVVVGPESAKAVVLLALREAAFLDYGAVLSLSPAVDADLLALLTIFVSGVLTDFRAFETSHPGFLEANRLETDALTSKIRLLTLSTLAATSPNLTVPYKTIATALEIEDEEIELWIIDVIRAGLLQGKMSQLEQKFFVHGVVPRTFGIKDWQDIGRRLDVWKTSLSDVLAVLRSARVAAQNKIDKERVAPDGVVV
ncbi:uncharacterized protein V1518DRAFT_415995 [Limtongia smithiae]|uniref:uncharacterized protein n=1 Tax=Limtongia smithiae TaxID=1125753 RepID=UPI0034CD483E